MAFEVYTPFGVKVAEINSDNPADIGTPETLQAMAGAGYKFKQNGKAYKLAKTEKSGSRSARASKTKNTGSGAIQCSFA